MTSASPTRNTTQVAVLTACVGLAVIYAWFAARSFQAARLGSSLDIASVERAVAIEPRNAAYQNLLCRYLLFDKQEPEAALASCRRATELNRYQSSYWLDLALADYSTGDERGQEQAIRAAVAIDPMTPDVAWNAANFFLTQGKMSDALPEFAVAMRGDVNAIQPSLALLWRTTHFAPAIQALLPPNPYAYLTFIRLLVVNKQWDAAQHVWSAMLQLGAAPDPRQSLFYVDALLQQHEVARAGEAWEQLVSRSPQLQPYARRSGDLVVDGGFEQPMLNAGFDWRYSPQSGCSVALDHADFHSGSQSIMVSYNGAGGDSGILQYVPVKPNAQYTISGWAKSEQLDAANGPVLSVWDANNKLLAKTPETLGSTSWHTVEARFQTGEQTTLVAIRITRDPADTHARGKFWLDDISLRP